MSHHFNRYHKNKDEEAQEENRAPPANRPKIQSDISSFVFNDKPCLDKEISGLLAEAGPSFRVVSTSTRIRKEFKALGHDIPNTDKGVRACLFRFYDPAKAKIKAEIEAKLKNGSRMSLTTDEWTPVQNRS